TWQRKVDVFVTLSGFAKEKLIDGGLPAEKVLVKPNFVHPDPGVGTSPRGFALFAGRLAKEKGILAVLDAWKRLDIRIPLKIVGDGPLATTVHDAARRMPWIEVLKWARLSEVYDLMGRARFVLFPTEVYETFGRVVIEAYAKGTPVIASDMGAARLLVDEGASGLLFRPGDADDLARKVEWMWQQSERVSAMGRCARLEYETKYTGPQNLAMMEEIYALAIEANHRSAAASRGGAN